MANPKEQPQSPFTLQVSSIRSICKRTYTETPTYIIWFLFNPKPSRSHTKLLELMEITKHAHAANRSYEDFDPLFVWRREESRDTLELHLPGFKREQIRIQINHAGFLVISGERAWDGGNRWKRFRKEFEIPSYCNENAIHGNMMQSILSVVMPKKSHLIQEEEEQQHKKEKETNNNKEEEEESETTRKETIGEHRREYEFEEREVRLPQETTKEVALKFMLVMVLILVIASYLADISKSLMAEAQSYFHN